MANNFESSDEERNLVLALRGAKKQDKENLEKPIDLDDIKAGMDPATRRRIMERIRAVWSQ